MRAMRSAMPIAERSARSAAAADRLLALDEVRAARTAFVFNSFGSEISTEGLIDALASRGVALALPRLKDGALEAVPYRPGDPLGRASYGALEPGDLPSVDPRDVDLVVAPGLAFDGYGYRLGYGGGYYDGFLRRPGVRAARIGFGFDAQIVERVPRDERDERLDAVVSELRVLRAPAI
jgi:5-formyltetrahydrofolate cyclo-ligase